jgi:flagellar assembly factor FliW
MSHTTCRRDSPGEPSLQSPGASPVSDSVDAPTRQDRAVQEGVAVNDDVPEIDFVRPLPGFPDVHRFVLVQLDDGGNASAGGGARAQAEPVLYELRGVQQPGVRFLVGVPNAFFPEYVFDLDEATCSELSLTAAEDALVLVILTIGDDSTLTTANLLAPVVINARTRSAAQVILSGTAWPVRAAIV